MTTIEATEPHANETHDTEAPLELVETAITRLSGQIAAATAQLLKWVGEYDRREGWGVVEVSGPSDLVDTGATSAATVGSSTGSFGGHTRLDNLVSLCGFHHRLVHEGGWTISIADSAVVWSDPHGVPATVEPLVGDLGALAEHCARQRRLAAGVPAGTPIQRASGLMSALRPPPSSDRSGVSTGVWSDS